MADAEVYVSGGRKPTGLRVVEWAREAEQRGAGEILLTSMDTDGMRNGFDCELTRRVSEAVQIPVIAIGRRRLSRALCRGLSKRAKPTPLWPPASFTSASPIPAPSKPRSRAQACPCGCPAKL